LASILPCLGVSSYDYERRLVFLAELENRLRALPGVQHAAIAGSSPVFGYGSDCAFLVEGQPEPPPDKYSVMFYEPVTGDYSATLGARLQQGRSFDTTDTADHPNVVIVNETMAHTFFPDESPIGKRLISSGLNPTGPKLYFEIVGVVNDLAFPGKMEKPHTRFEAYVPLMQAAPPYLTILLRTSSSAESMSNTLRNAVAGLNESVAVYQIRSARAAIDSGLGSISLLGSLLGAFATIGVMLAAIGIYGVVSYTVVQRTAELGIRLALGAQARDVFGLVLGKGAILVLTGALLGGLGAYGVSRLLISLIPTLPTRDPLVVPLAALALIVVALVAC